LLPAFEQRLFAFAFCGRRPCVSSHLVVCPSQITTGRAAVAAGKRRSKLVVGGTRPVDTGH
jgi:hypothetical protein